MKWSVIIRPRAEADLLEAKNWYEQRRERLGAEWVLAVRQALRVLRENPEATPAALPRFSARAAAPLSLQAVLSD